MTRPAMWTMQRKAALAIAAEWSIPGMDPDDVRQEALVALWVAAGKHDPERGPWPPFARMCVKTRMRDLLQAANRRCRAGTTLPLDPERDADPVQLSLLAEHREETALPVAEGRGVTVLSVRTVSKWAAYLCSQRGYHERERNASPYCAICGAWIGHPAPAEDGESHRKEQTSSDA